MGVVRHQGTVRDWAEYDSATDTTSVTNHLKYDAFGNITDQSDPNATPLYAYTGREWDADADLYYYRARWYDPAVGRFISEDPLGFAAGDPNLQRYVSNAPTNAVDPSGLEEQPSPFGADIFIDANVPVVDFRGMGGLATEPVWTPNDPPPAFEMAPIARHKPGPVRGFRDRAAQAGYQLSGMHRSPHIARHNNDVPAKAFGYPPWYKEYFDRVFSWENPQPAVNGFDSFLEGSRQTAIVTAGVTGTFAGGMAVAGVSGPVIFGGGGAAAAGGGVAAGGTATFVQAVTAFGGPAAFGRLIGLGVGRAAAVARTGNITLAEIQAAGVTMPVARYWRDFYQAAVEAGRGATTAAARVQLFDRIIELLGG